MSSGSVFDDDASRKLEAAYLTPDVVAQRRETLRALALQPGERLLDVGAGPGLLVAEVVGQSRSWHPSGSRKFLYDFKAGPAGGRLRRPSSRRQRRAGCRGTGLTYPRWVPEQ
jgi:Mycolic acid cyclopropane synthetase